MERLEHDPHVGASEAGERVLAHAGEVLAERGDPPGGRGLEPAHQHEERGLAGAGRADEAERLAAADLERDPTQNVDRAGVAFEGERDILEGDDGSRHMKPFADWVGTLRAYGAALALRNLAAAALLLLAVPAAADVRILAFGDSLTQGYGLPEAEGFVPRLQAWLAANGAGDVTVVNGGVSGDTSAGGLARIAWSLGDDIDGVIVELGANDMLRGIDPAVTTANLDGILTEIDKRGLPALVAGIAAPANYPEAYRAAYASMFRDLAEKHGAIFYSAFLGGLGDGRSMREVTRLLQRDGLHPNAEGVQAIVDHIGPAVLELVAEARQRS